MILVDTSVWIDHLHRSEPTLVSALKAGNVGSHPGVIEDLALGTLADRDKFLALLADLAGFPVLSHEELLNLVAAHALWGCGLSPTDVHLLGAVLLSPGSSLWTRDKRLIAAADRIGVSRFEPPTKGSR